MMTPDKLKVAEQILKGYPHMDITNINENEIHVVWGVAYTTPQKLEEIRERIGAKRTCITWTPSMISKGVAIFFEL